MVHKVSLEREICLIIEVSCDALFDNSPDILMVFVCFT